MYSPLVLGSLGCAIAIAACAGAPPIPPAPPTTSSEPAAAPVAVEPAPVELPDESQVITMSQHFLRSVDQRDEESFVSVVGPAFVLFEDGRYSDASSFVRRMRAGKEKQRPPRSRTCKDELVFRGGGALVYCGLCTEQVPAHGEDAATSWEGWNTVVWTAPGDGVGPTWKVAHWGWQKGGIEAERDMWNETYRKSLGFRREPNRHLVAAVKGRRPGTALDIAMGQGRNAVFLASQGWKVTGVDISDEGIRLAREAAAKRKLRLETVVQDIEKYDLGTERWDLVTMIYAGNDKKLVERIKPSLKKGGLFVVEVFHSEATTGSSLGGFQTGELAALFAGWNIVTDEVVEDEADWSRGKTKLVRFTAQKP